METPNPLPEAGFYWLRLPDNCWTVGRFDPIGDRRGLTAIGDDTLVMWATIEELAQRLESPAEHLKELGPSDRVLGRTKLYDVDVERSEPSLEVLAVAEGLGSGIALHPQGYGLKTMETGFCGVVYLEHYQGHPRLIVFADINDEEPTHIISLGGAHESERDED